MHTRVIVLVGPRGCGKTTLIDTVVAKNPAIKTVPSFTTRPREERDNNETYEFITHDEYRSRLEYGNIVQYVENDGNVYGNTRSQFAALGKSIGILAMTEKGANALTILHYNVRIVKIVPVGMPTNSKDENNDRENICSVKTHARIVNDFAEGGLEKTIVELEAFIATTF